MQLRESAAVSERGEVPKLLSTRDTPYPRTACPVPELNKDYGFYYVYARIPSESDERHRIELRIYQKMISLLPGASI